MLLFESLVPQASRPAAPRPAHRPGRAASAAIASRRTLWASSSRSGAGFTLAPPPPQPLSATSMPSGTEQPAAAAEPVVPRPIADEELQLLARYTGQSDLGALREHVTALWQRACSGSAPVYLCVRALMFLEPRIRSHPAYQRALQLMANARQAAAAAACAPPGNEGSSGEASAAAAAAAAAHPPPPVWIDVGAAVGTDVRQLRLDGLRYEELVALDVPPSRHYW